MVENIRNLYPFSDIVLQTVAGAPDGNDCGTRAGEQYPFVKESIKIVASRNSDVSIGMAPQVGDCSHFSDTKGHLNSEGSDYAGRVIAEWYER